MSIHRLVEQALVSADIDETIALTQQAFKEIQTVDEGHFECSKTILPIEHVRFPAKPVCVPPKQLPRRRLGSEAGKRSFIHAIAHIEFNAIKLALDIAYRFARLPLQFYKDWLFVANDECKHFLMLCDHLKQYDCEYGDLPSHDGLWSMAVKTEHDLIARLSLVPRYLEARGLDVTPAMIEKLYELKDEQTAKILEVILNDEVLHVKHGTTWLKYACQEKSLAHQDLFFQHIQYYLKGQILGPFNRPLRLKAGFSDMEIDQLEELDQRAKNK